MKKETKRVLAQISIVFFTIIFLAGYISTSAFQNFSPNFTCKVTQVITRENIHFYYCQANCFKILEAYNGSGVLQLLTLNNSPVLYPCIIVAFNDTLKLPDCREVYLAQGICQRGNTEVKPQVLIIYNISASSIQAKIYQLGGYLLGVEK